MRTIREYLESRYLKYLNVERTGKMYGTIVGKSDDDEDGTEPLARGNYQRIGRPANAGTYNHKLESSSQLERCSALRTRPA